MLRNSITDESMSCMFCGSFGIRASKFRRRISWENKHFTYLYCRHCNGYSLYPLLVTVDLEKLYSSDYETTNVIPSSDNSQYFDNHGYQFSFSYLRENVGPGSLFCDFGCGSNSTLRDFVRSLGATYYGVEYDEEVVANLAREFPNEFFLTPAHLMESNLKFDYVFLGDVLEHVSVPSRLLKDVCQKLNPNGEILVQGPLENADSFLHTMIKLKSFFVLGRAIPQMPYHVSLASRRSILELFTRSNLDVKLWHTYEVLWPIQRTLQLKLFSQTIILNAAKWIDLNIKRFSKKRGNRFFAVVKLGNLDS